MTPTLILGFLVLGIVVLMVFGFGELMTNDHTHSQAKDAAEDEARKPEKTSRGT